MVPMTYPMGQFEIGKHSESREGTVLLEEGAWEARAHGGLVYVALDPEEIVNAFSGTAPTVQLDDDWQLLVGVGSQAKLLTLHWYAPSAGASWSVRRVRRPALEGTTACYFSV